MGNVKGAHVLRSKTCGYCHQAVRRHVDSITESPPGAPKILFHLRCYKHVRKARKLAERRSRPVSPPAPLGAQATPDAVGVAPSRTDPAKYITRGDVDTLLEMLANAERRLVALEQERLQERLIERHRHHATPEPIPEPIPTNGPPPDLAPLTLRGEPRQRRKVRESGSLTRALFAVMHDGHARTVGELRDAVRARGELVQDSGKIATLLSLGRMFRNHIVREGRRPMTRYRYVARAQDPSQSQDLLVFLRKHFRPGEPFFGDEARALFPAEQCPARQSFTLRLKHDPRVENLGHDLWQFKPETREETLHADHD